MKRSHAVTLVAMGAGAVGLYAAYGPEASRDAHIYQTVDDCVLSGPTDGITAARCRAEYDAARAEHLRSAPRYSTQIDCEREYGVSSCESAVVSGKTLFLPRVVGYMFGDRAASQSFATQPLYAMSQTARLEQCQMDPKNCPPPLQQPVEPRKPGSLNFLCSNPDVVAMMRRSDPNACTAVDQPSTQTPSTNQQTSSSSSGTSHSTSHWYSTSHGSPLFWNTASHTTSSTSTGTSLFRPSHTIRVPGSVASNHSSRVNVVSRFGFGSTGRSLSFHVSS